MVTISMFEHIEVSHFLSTCFPMTSSLLMSRVINLTEKQKKRYEALDNVICFYLFLFKPIIATTKNIFNNN